MKETILYKMFYFKTRTGTDHGVVLKTTPKSPVLGFIVEIINLIIIIIIKSPDIKTCISNQGNLSFEVLKILILINPSLHEKDNYDWIERNVP